MHQSGAVIAERYCILSPLGQGGNGITYEAEDLKSKQRVALKTLSLRNSSDWKQLELFEREAQILKQLNHPAIPRYLDYFQVDTAEDRAFYIAQELAAGKSLAAKVEQGWRTNEQGVRKIAEQVLEILIYLHSFYPPVIHRDIKPQNLILSPSGKISLVDFGAVQATYHNTMVRGSTIVGTYGYMAPEQFRGQAVPVTDLYGLGTTLLFLLTHRLPTDLPQERLKIIFRQRVQISESFAHWLETLLEPDVEDRFASAQEALLSLKQKVLHSQPVRPLLRSVLAHIGVAGIAAIPLLVLLRYPVMRLLGIVPPDLCQTNSVEIWNYLNQGGDPNPALRCLYSSGSSPSYQNRLEMVEMLFEKGDYPNPNILISEGQPILLAVIEAGTNGDPEVARFLIKKGADVNAHGLHDTPLILAVKKKQVTIAMLLIEKGADVNAKDPHGRTPLRLARELNGSSDLVRLLIEKGAKE